MGAGKRGYFLISNLNSFSYPPPPPPPLFKTKTNLPQPECGNLETFTVHFLEKQERKRPKRLMTKLQLTWAQFTILMWSPPHHPCVETTKLDCVLSMFFGSSTQSTRKMFEELIFRQRAEIEKDSAMQRTAEGEKAGYQRAKRQRSKPDLVISKLLERFDPLLIQWCVVVCTVVVLFIF